MCMCPPNSITAGTELLPNIMSTVSPGLAHTVVVKDGKMAIDWLYIPLVASKMLQLVTSWLINLSYSA